MICVKRTLVKVTPLLKISVQSIQIVLDHENLTYFGGEKINGYCHIQLIDYLDMDKINIKFFGQAKTYLETNKSRNAIECERLFQQYYWPKNDFSTKILNAGHYRIPFNFIIPKNIPSTFKYTFDSHIKYKIKATFGLTIKYLNVTILTNPNISISKLLIPICDLKKKKIGFIPNNGSTKTNKIIMKCYLSRIGFTLGQSIPVECTIENYTNKLLKLKSILHQQIILMALSERKICCHKINKCQGPLIQSNSKFNGIFSVTLPEQLPIVFDTCNLVHINYILDIYIDIPYSFNNLHCRLPIILTYQKFNTIDLFQTNNDNNNCKTIKTLSLCSFDEFDNNNNENNKDNNSDIINYNNDNDDI